VASEGAAFRHADQSATRLSDNDWRLINFDLDRDIGWFKKFSISKFQGRDVASSS
jgi:hypothetical protein